MAGPVRRKIQDKTPPGRFADPNGKRHSELNAALRQVDHAKQQLQKHRQTLLARAAAADGTKPEGE